MWSINKTSNKKRAYPGKVLGYLYQATKHVPIQGRYWATYIKQQKTCLSREGTGLPISSNKKRAYPGKVLGYLYQATKNVPIQGRCWATYIKQRKTCLSSEGAGLPISSNKKRAYPVKVLGYLYPQEPPPFRASQTILRNQKIIVLFTSLSQAGAATSIIVVTTKVFPRQTQITSFVATKVCSSRQT